MFPQKKSETRVMVLLRKQRSLGARGVTSILMALREKRKEQ